MKCKVILTALSGMNEFQINLIEQVSLLEQFKINKIPIANSCGGFGTCGTCQIAITSGLQHLAPPEELEQEWQTDRNHSLSQRLSCQCFLVESPSIDQSGQMLATEELIIQITGSSKS